MFDIFNKHFFTKSSKITRGNQDDLWSDVFLKPSDVLLPDSKKLFGGSMILLFLLAVLLITALFVRIVYLQVFNSEKYEERAYNNHVRTYITRALRGVVYDANDTLLVENIPRDDVAIVPADLPREKQERTSAISELATILNMRPEEINASIKDQEFLYTPVVIKRDISHDIKLQVLLTFPDKKYGIVMVPDFYRKYLTEDDMSFLLGYLGKITREEWLVSENEYTYSAEIGKTGIEKSYETILKGNNGEQIINVNAAGKLENILATSEPVAGCDMKLTIDTDLQNRVSALLLKTLESSDTNAGVVVIQDPRTGEILSMVSLPTYDNRVMSNGVIGEAESALFDKWINDEHTPFLHRAISGVYPPGSTYKIVTASAALESGTITVNDYIDSPGQIVIPSWFDPELTFIYKDWKSSGHGFLNVIEALEESSDTFFYKVSGGFEQIQGMGLLTLNDYARYYGVGSKLGVDLPQESAGVLPNEQWKQETIGEGWYVGDTYNMAIGQGYLLMTPLQVNTYTSVIANGGTVYKPQVVREILNCDNQRSIEPEVLHTDFLADDTIDAVRTGLRQVITGPNGTAKSLRNLSVAVAGKTGTAQYNNNEQEHAWFTAYAPYDDPQIAITVLIEGGGEGSEVAVPLAGQIIEMYFADTE